MEAAVVDVNRLQAQRRNHLLFAWMGMALFVLLMGAAAYSSTQSEGWDQLIRVVPWMVVAIVAVSFAQRRFKKATEVEAKLANKAFGGTGA